MSRPLTVVCLLSCYAVNTLFSKHLELPQRAGYYKALYSCPKLFVFCYGNVFFVLLFLKGWVGPLHMPKIICIFSMEMYFFYRSCTWRRTGVNGIEQAIEGKVAIKR
jgi:hypothetical protein